MEITGTCVERADSVLVQGEMGSVSDDALMLYFSNKKRSRGGEVKSLIWREKRTSAVITFEDCQGMFSFILYYFQDSRKAGSVGQETQHQ